MWPIIGLIIVTILFMVYGAVHVRLVGNLQLMYKHPSIILMMTDQQGFLSASDLVIKRHKDSAAKIYRESIPLLAFLLFWPIGPHLCRKSILSAYNNGKPLLEWNPNPKLWDDLVKGYASKDRSLSTEEMEGFIRVLSYVLMR
jgi:hypothetical protein